MCAYPDLHTCIWSGLCRECVLSVYGGYVYRWAASRASEVCCCLHLSRTVKACLCRSAWDWIFLKHTDSLTSRFYVQPIFYQFTQLATCIFVQLNATLTTQFRVFEGLTRNSSMNAEVHKREIRKSCCESGTGGGTEAQSQSEALEIILYGYVKALSIQTLLWYPQQSNETGKESIDL